MSFRAASLGVLLLLSACFGLERVDQLREAPRPTTPYAQELARLYLQFVDSELEKYDWDSAGYFAGKGLAAAKGEAIAPELPEQWDIPGYAIDELQSARRTVEAKLTPSFKHSNPQAAASLLFHFDCWVEEQEEAWETEAIERCKHGVMMHLEETDPPVAMGGPLSTSYLFHFPLDEAQLEGMARDELAVIADTLGDMRGGYQVVINGHADRSGNSGYSMALSEQRAQYIREFLSRRGVPAAYITYNPFSDSQLASDMDASSRVEIFIE